MQTHQVAVLIRQLEVHRNVTRLVRSLFNTFNIVATAVIYWPPSRISKIGGIVWVRSNNVLGTICDSITIAVYNQRVGHMNAGFLTIGQAIAIRVSLLWIGTQEGLVFVADAIKVGINRSRQISNPISVYRFMAAVFDA